MAGTIALPLQEFIASLDNASLPKILQVCSGVYFQGSIYEISGSEVCFSTGDLVKVIGLLELHNCKNYVFSVLFYLSFRHEGKEDMVRCHVRGETEASAEVCIPLSSRGEFYECESEECYTLKEIMSSPCLRIRRFRFVKTTKCERILVFSPIYQVQAIMNLRKNVLRFPSSLEVDVVDVTDVCKDVNFVTPLSLTEVLSQPDNSFPVVAEILEEPQSRSFFKCAWLPGLVKSTNLVLHKKGTTPMVLMSSLKGRKNQQYFLVSQQYGGKFRRRPREFNSVYELYVASTQTQGLTVSVTRNCEEVEEEGMPDLSIGEKLKIVKNTQKDKQEEEKEEVLLPLYMQGHFVEILSENKKYKLSDLGKEFSLPLDVKVVSRDTELETDPLFGSSCLRIEGAMLEPSIQASFQDRPDHCFHILPQWLSMSDNCPKCFIEKVSEVTDTFFYDFRKKDNSDEAPPPRPPKRDLSSSNLVKKTAKSTKKSANPKKKKDKTIPTEKLNDLTLNQKKRPPAPPPPVSTVHFKDRANTCNIISYCFFLSFSEHLDDAPADVESDHDYETLDETLVTMVKTEKPFCNFNVSLI
uniref:Thymocyte selection associated family member 2 n=1 Tax=Cyprinodon variegatus TaxID=28743 RepID=A0A3Q2D7L6_CYPVA